MEAIGGMLSSAARSFQKYPRSMSGEPKSVAHAKAAVPLSRPDNTPSKNIDTQEKQVNPCCEENTSEFRSPAGECVSYDAQDPMSERDTPLPCPRRDVRNGDVDSNEILKAPLEEQPGNARYARASNTIAPASQSAALTPSNDSVNECKTPKTKPESFQSIVSSDGQTNGPGQNVISANIAAQVPTQSCSPTDSTSTLVGEGKLRVHTDAVVTPQQTVSVELSDTLNERHSPMRSEQRTTERDARPATIRTETPLYYADFRNESVEIEHRMDTIERQAVEREQGEGGDEAGGKEGIGCRCEAEEGPYPHGELNTRTNEDPHATSDSAKPLCVSVNLSATEEQPRSDAGNAVALHETEDNTHPGASPLVSTHSSVVASSELMGQQRADSRTESGAVAEGAKPTPQLETVTELAKNISIGDVVELESDLSADVAESDDHLIPTVADSEPEDPIKPDCGKSAEDMEARSPCDPLACPHNVIDDDSDLRDPVCSESYVEPEGDHEQREKPPSEPSCELTAKIQHELAYEAGVAGPQTALSSSHEKASSIVANETALVEHADESLKKSVVDNGTSERNAQQLGVEFEIPATGSESEAVTATEVQSLAQAETEPAAVINSGINLGVEVRTAAEELDARAETATLSVERMTVKPATAWIDPAPARGARTAKGAELWLLEPLVFATRNACESPLEPMIDAPSSSQIAKSGSIARLDGSSLTLRTLEAPRAASNMIAATPMPLRATGSEMSPQPGSAPASHLEWAACNSPYGAYLGRADPLHDSGTSDSSLDERDSDIDVPRNVSKLLEARTGSTLVGTQRRQHGMTKILIATTDENGELQPLDEKWPSLGSEMSKLKDLIKTQEAEIEAATRARERLSSICSQQEETLNRMVKKNKDLGESVRRLHEELNSLRAQLTGEIANKRKVKAQLEARITQYEHKCEEAQRAAGQYKQRCQELNEKIATAMERDEQTVMLEAMVERTRREVAEVRDRCMREQTLWERERTRYKHQIEQSLCELDREQKKRLSLINSLKFS